MCSSDLEVMLINFNGVIIRIKASDVSRLGRATQGVRIMKVDEDTKIISMAKVIQEEDDDKNKKKEADHNGQMEINTRDKEK